MIATWMRSFHDAAGDASVYVVPFLAPLLSAVAVYNGLRVDMWPVWACLVGAIVIEGLGFAGSSLALRAYADRAGLVVYIAAGAMGVTYLLAVYGILAGTHTSGYVFFFPLLTLVGAMAVAILDTLEHNERKPQEEARAKLRLDMERRRALMEIREDAKDRAANRPIAVPKPSQIVPSGTVQPEVEGGTRDKMRRILAHLETDRYASLATIASATGIPRSTVARRLKEANYTKNGNGWEK